MVFSSAIFLFLFLPLTLGFYFALPWLAAKNVVLLLASLLFYAWGEPVYVVLMVVSILVNWGFALIMDRAMSRAAASRRSQGALPRGARDGEVDPPGDDDGFDSLDVPSDRLGDIRGEERRARSSKGATVALAIVLVIDLGLLGVFKYLGFFCAQVNNLVGSPILPEVSLALPIGISFYTLQAVSYVVDVWRGDVRAQANPLYLGMYISMFPQLVAGPIVRYSEIEEAVDDRHVTLAGFARGIRLFAVGMGKKMLLANVCGVLADALLVLPPEEIGFVGCASAVCAYTFQIYFDFGGYSDMAIGLGSMFGFSYPRNFNYPYISSSVTEFWRRWHMTLGSFFRDYVYIPLGGNRVSTPRWMLNILIVWGLTGIWHGAAWNFLLWGLYYGVILMCEKLFLLSWLERVPRFFRHLYTIVVFFFGWLLFSVVGLSNVAHWVLAIFGRYGWLGTSTLWELQSWSYVSLVPVLVLASTPVIPWIRKRFEAWLAGRPAAGIVAAPQKGNDFVPPCELVVPADVLPSRRGAATAVAILADLALLAVFALSVISVVSSSYNPFIYFQF